MRRAFMALVLYSLAAAAQHIGENRPQSGADSTPIFKSGALLVVETVAVTDKSGKPIEGLTAKDFTITEDVVPQAIKIFEYQRLSDVAPPAPLTESEHARVYDKLGRTRISGGTPGDTRYKDRRLLALYFDMTAMPESDQVRALSAALKFIRTQMTAQDMVAILRYSGGSVEVLEDFTADRNRLMSIVQTLIVGEGQGFGRSTDEAADPGAAFGQDDSEFNIFNTDRQLSALQTAAQMLAQLSEKKALVYFASGLRLNGLNNQAQLRATVNAAIRAGVAFWPIDARGLVALPPLGDATQGSPGSAAMYSGVAMTSLTTNFQRSQDTLYSLAADTGGKALLDTNDLERGIVQAEQSVSSYYVIGYYAANKAQDGKFRRIKVALNDAEAKLDYRQGYFAGNTFAKFTAADKERQLEDALMLPDPITELTIAMEIDYFQINRAEYFVPLVVKIPGRELALAKRGGAERTSIDFIGEIKDSFGSTITNVRDKVRAKLTDATAQELARRPIVYDAGFTLLPGQYTIKLLARDDETGRIGTFQTTFTVPNLNKIDKNVPISSVVLSSQRIDLKDALYNALKNKTETSNPLVRNGQKIIPSVTRVFSRKNDMYVYLQAYQHDDAPARPLVAYVTFYREGEKVSETRPIQTSGSQAPGRLKSIPMEFRVLLMELPPGRYDCQISVLDPDGHKAAFWQAPVVFLQ
jgi:VWFA-related protein